MAGDTVITVVGNLTADPELRFTPSGAAVANFPVASTPPPWLHPFALPISLPVGRGCRWRSQKTA